MASTLGFIWLLVTFSEKHRIYRYFSMGNSLNQRVIQRILILNRLIGPTNVVFRDIFPEYLEKVPLQLKLIIQLKHDGAPTYLFYIVRYYMNLMNRDRWIERGASCAYGPQITHILIAFCGENWSMELP